MLKIQRLITPYNRTKMVGKKNIAISIHYVGAVSSAYNNALYFYNNDLRGKSNASSANYFVDPISIWQSVEDFDASWSVGAKKYYNEVRNSNSISIEMCCKKTKDGEWYFDEQTVKNTVDLVKYLKAKYGIKKIYRHWDITHKRCPAPYMDNAKWQEFLKEVDKVEPTINEKLEKIKEYYGFDDNTGNYLLYYRYNVALIDKLYNKIK